MKIAIFGLGYVGLTTLCCVASEGHSVLGIDPDGKKVDQVVAGTVPIKEPGLQELLEQALERGRIDASTSVPDNMSGVDLAMVCVGTPSAPDGSHDMSHVVQVSSQIARSLRGRDAGSLTVAYRSTFRPGTIDQVIAPIYRDILGDDYASMADIVYNPEFLRESTAVADYYSPPKIVVGTSSGRQSDVLSRLYDHISAPRFNVEYAVAEMTKFVDNSWHATKIAFANEIGRVCLELGIPASQVHEIFKSDTKLNLSSYYTRPGGPFGGSCLPKDLRALQHIALDSGVNAPLLQSVLLSNEAHKARLAQLAVEGLAPGSSILLVGLAFKADTDDLRESPNIDLARWLIRAGFVVSIFDPNVDPAHLMGANLGYAYTWLPSLAGRLVDKRTAESGIFDRIVATNRSVASLEFAGTEMVIDLDSI